MRTPFFQIDAFTSHLFAGNPAAVLILDGFPRDGVMQAIAEENNLAETAFIVPDGGDYRIRWFTPKVEVPLCGHATLASGAAIMERIEPERMTVTFQSASGPLIVSRAAKGYILDFPSRKLEVAEAPRGLEETLGAPPVEVLADRFNYLVLLANAGVVRGLAPDIPRIATFDRSGLIVTAPGDYEYDFVSRYFAPAKGIPEDPVTGAAHCALAPYWAKRIAKREFRAFQASRRGGEVTCRLKGDRVELLGECVFYLEGQIDLEGPPSTDLTPTAPLR